MLFAEKEISKNIAEYVLYLWQMEDLLRALNFDMAKVEQLVRTSADIDEVSLRRELNRYQLLIGEMREEGLMETGHLTKSLKAMAELHYLHQNLLQVKKDKTYFDLYAVAQPHILEFMGKTGKNRLTEIEVCFNALYGLLLLRLKKEPVSPATQEAMDSFSKLLAYLAAKYKAATDK